MKSLLRILIIFLIPSCHFGDFSEPLTANYELDAIDVKRDMSIYVSIDESWVGVVDATVFAVGYNEDFIIAKQHPDFDKRVTNYYIIPLKFKVADSPDENRIGPLTEREFMEKRKELGVPRSLQFTRVFKDLE